MIRLSRYKPSATNRLLLLLAGFVWTIVGLWLLLLAYFWLSRGDSMHIQLLAVSGVVLGLLVHHFGFLKIADSNLQRILFMDKKSCLFAFIPWKSYLIMAVMVTMGVILRHSAIPKHYLAVLYIGIGLALVLSSIRYFRVFVQEVRK